MKEGLKSDCYMEDHALQNLNTLRSGYISSQFKQDIFKG